MDKLGDYHLQVARAHLRLGDFDRAVKAAQVASGLMPQSAQPWGVLGTIHVARGDLKRAEAMYAKAVEVDPSFGPGRVALGHVYNIEKKPQEALAEYETALRTNPKYVPALRAKIATLVEQKRIDEALGVVQVALKDDPKNAELITILASLYDKKGDRKKTEEELKSAIQTDEKYVPARFMVARLLLADKREADAIAQLQRILAERPGDVAATLMLTNIHAAQIRYEQAIAILEPAVKARSAARELTLALGDLYIKQARFDDAVALLSPMVSADPSFVQPRILLGLGFLGKYNTAEAIKQFEQVNQINPKIAESHYYLARALLARGDVDGARKAYQQALALAPDSKGIRIELAALSGQKPDDALLASQVVELKGALDRDPGNIAVRHALARAYLSRNQRKEGEAEYRRILAVAPTFVPANLAVAMLRLQDGKLDEAADFLKAVVRTEPQNLQANLLLGDYFRGKGNLEAAILNNLAWIYASRSENLEEALSLALGAQELAPDSPAILDTVGFVHYKRKEYSKAEPVLRRAAELGAKMAPIHYHLGMTYYRLGKQEDAIASLKRSLQLDGQFSDADEARRVLRELGAS